MTANFAFSDLHGNLNAWRAIQARAGMEDRLWCLGDVADRGPDGYQMLREILADPRVVYLKGNHDDMFVQGTIGGNTELLDHWLTWCGGMPTYDAWIEDGSPRDIVEKLGQAPTKRMLTTRKGLILMSHAGYTPKRHALTDPSDDDLLWGREHFSDPWELGDERVYVVHGHTPVTTGYFGVYATDPLFYCEGHKVCIDLGTIQSHACALLNLDDFSFEVIRV